MAEKDSPHITRLEDSALLNLIAQSNRDALAVLYDRYGRLVFSLAVNIVGDQAAAEEITQDVFLSVWEKAHTYRASAARVSTWLSSIARYRAIDILRRRGVRPEQSSISWDDVGENLLPVDYSTVELAELGMLQKRVRAAISELPAEQREALALAFFGGYSHQEISQALGQPLGTVKTRIRLAMKKLRDRLDADDADS
ncbi:MAG: RNA polymerase sigma factor [Anaerolineales bacterium]|jgi:RNA polymerase sigma-70 factor (ECF subfamily)